MSRIRLVPCTLALTAGALAIAAVSPAGFFQEMPAPTEHHKQILQAVGEWEGTLTSYMPGVPEEAVPAKQTVRAIGEFWTQTRFECPFMGMTYIGEGASGYDVETERFVATWVDSMSSYMAIMEGEFDEEKNALVMRWDAPSMTGEMESHRYELVQTEDTYTSTFYTGEGEGTKSMVIALKRVSGATEAAATK